jgi:hypothetical protein
MAIDIGHGSFVKFDTAGPLGSNVTAQYRVVDFDWSGVKRSDPVDISHILSTANEFIASPVYDPGEVKVNVQYDPSISIVPRIGGTAATATNSVVWLVFANGGSNNFGYSAYGQVQGIDSVKATRDDLMTATVTIKLSGELGTATTGW